MRSVALTALAVLAACTTQPAGTPPDGLTWEAVELQSVVERGCLPYAMGEKSEAEAMRDAELALNTVTFSWPSPPVGKPQYMSKAPGKPIVTIYGPGCTIRIRGDAAAFDRSLDHSYTARFGADFGAHPVSQPLDERFPGMRRYCIAGRTFQSYPDPPDGIVHGGFNVMIAPAPAPCTAA